MLTLPCAVKIFIYTQPTEAGCNAHARRKFEYALDSDPVRAEQMLRRVVIGRKNYLFAGSEAGAKQAAILYSLVASCKWHGHDPFAYFNDVLKKVTTCPASKIDDLLPVNWTPPAQSTAPKLDPLPNHVA